MLVDKNDSLIILVDVQEKLTPLVVEPKALISRCEWLLRLATRLSVPIIISEQYPQGLGKTLEPLNEFHPSKNFIEKVHFSCMQSQAMQDLLNHYKKNQIILIGIEAHVCVLQTAMELRSTGKEVYIVVDAVSSRSAMDKKYALKRMEQEGVHLITSEMVFFEWLRRAGTPEFKALSKEFM